MTKPHIFDPRILNPNTWLLATALAMTAGVTTSSRAAEPEGIAPANPPMTASQLIMSAQQSGIPQASVSSQDAPTVGIPKVRAVTINIRRVGKCDGHVTLKTCFVGTDVTTFKKVINSQFTKEAEAIPGKGNEYTETSSPFVYYPASVDPKTNKPIPAHGVQPMGWVVRVYQGERLVTATASVPELIAWLNTQGG